MTETATTATLPVGGTTYEPIYVRDRDTWVRWHRGSRSYLDVPAPEMTYVAEGWWHPNVKSGQVHDHKPVQSQTMHRLCVEVYTKRSTDG